MVVVVAAGVLTVGSVSAFAGANVGRPPMTRQVQSPSDPEVFVSLAPLRVLDTRQPIGVSSVGPLTGDRQVDLALTSPAPNRPWAPVPPEATAAVLNVTIDEDASLKAFLTIWPTGQTRPFTSANNAEPGLVSPNQTVARLGAGGAISIYLQQGSANLAMDLVGYLLPLSAVPTTPASAPSAYAFGVDDSPVSLAPFASTSLTGEFGFGPEQIVFSVPALPDGDYLLSGSISFSKLPDGEGGAAGAQNDMVPECWWSTTPDRRWTGFGYAFAGPEPYPVSLSVTGRIQGAATADLVCRYGLTDADDSIVVRSEPLQVQSIAVNATPVTLTAVT